MSKKAVENLKKPVKKGRVMVFGTFDGLHPGHLNFFKQARDLVPHSFLIVSIARDKNVLKIKGRRSSLNETKRAALVKKSGLVDRVVLGSLDDHISHILKERPDIIALGYDQRAYVKNLKQELAHKNFQVKTVRLKSYKPKIYKNSILKKVSL